MANHDEVHVGDTHWVVRHAGRDITVEVLAKEKKASGKWEFRLKNLETGRTLTKGSGSLRREGEPAREAPPGFKRSEIRKKPLPRPRTNRAATTKPSAPETPAPPAPIYPSSTLITTPPAPAPPATTPSATPGALPSLRGTFRAPLPPPRPRPKKTSDNGDEYGCELARQVCIALKKCRSEWELRNKFSEVMASYVNSQFGIGLRPRH